MPARVHIPKRPSMVDDSAVSNQDKQVEGPAGVKITKATPKQVRRDSLDSDPANRVRMGPGPGQEGKEGIGNQPNKIQRVSTGGRGSNEGRISNEAGVAKPIQKPGVGRGNKMVVENMSTNRVGNNSQQMSGTGPPKRIGSTGPTTPMDNNTMRKPTNTAASPAENNMIRKTGGAPMENNVRRTSTGGMGNPAQTTGKSMPNKPAGSNSTQGQVVQNQTKKIGNNSIQPQTMQNQTNKVGNNSVQSNNQTINKTGNNSMQSNTTNKTGNNSMQSQNFGPGIKTENNPGKRIGNTPNQAQNNMKRPQQQGIINKPKEPEKPKPMEVETKSETMAVPPPVPTPSVCFGKMFIGGHMSTAGSITTAVTNAVNIKAKSFGLFLRNQRSWDSKPLEAETVKAFRDLCAEHKYPPHLILPHGSYLLNLGSPKEELRQKSVDLLIDELERCSQLGLSLFNIHPGSSGGEISREECITYIAEGINKALRSTQGVKVVLNNMSCQGHTIGGDLTELKAIIELVVDKSRIGVCLDTCHAMAAGYDLSTQEGFDKLIREFEEQVGFEWLVGVHLNDSKGPAGCHLDRHENIGKGTIGVAGFQRIMNCKHFINLPLILETPFDKEDTYQLEIDMLTKMVN